MNECTIAFFKFAIRAILLCGTLFVFAHPCRAQAGCGATAGGASQYDQSACGNVPPFPAPANGTPVSSCETLTSGTYTLSQDLTTAPTAICLIFQGTVVLDFAGHVITGRIMANLVHPSGMHLYSSAAGGGLTCSDSSSIHPGCIYIYGGGALNAPLEIDHLTLINTDTSSMNSARNLDVEFTPDSSSLGRGVGVKIHHISATSAIGTSSVRITTIAVVGNSRVNAEANNNRLRCKSDASSCNSLAFWGVNNIKVHNNLLINEKANPAITGDSARAALCDGGAHGCEGYNNYFDAQDGRAWRVRGTDNSYDVVSFHDNLINNITRGSLPDGYYGAIHVCDDGSGSDNGTGYVFQNNTLNIEDGVGLWSRNCANFPVFRNNKINCEGICGGLLARIRGPVQPVATTFELANNDPVPLTSNPQVYVSTDAVVDVCKSGTVGGPGTINETCSAGTSSGIINFSSGFTATGLVVNGSAKLNGNALRLTDGIGNEAGSAWYNTPISIQTFVTDFSVSISPGTMPTGDGLTFTIQAGGTSARGPAGGGLGYGPAYGTTAGVPNSVAVKFDLYDNAGEGNDSTGLYVNGASPTTPAVDMTGTGINLHSGHEFKVHLVYDGSILTLTITDESTNGSFTHAWPINIPAAIGANTAYVGFTGGTGGVTALQDILSWTYGR